MTPAFDAATWPARTQRLTIRPATVADANATWQYRRLPAVTRWMSSSPSSATDFVRQFSEPDRLAKTLVVEREGAVIGDLMLTVEDAWAQTEVAEQAHGVQAELGWCLSPEHTGHGYATEAVRGLIGIAFEEFGLRRLVANCFAQNEASWRLMERVHMRRELHSVRESLHRSEGWLDAYGYALLSDEWAQAGAGK